MQDSQSDFVTQLLEQVAAGDHAAQERLFELVYDELRDVAHWMMKGERGSHTLQPTALVNEAVLRLLNTDRLQEMPNRRYFFAAAARATRRVLVDHARHRDRQSSPKGEGASVYCWTTWSTRYRESRTSICWPWTKPWCS